MKTIHTVLRQDFGELDAAVIRTELLATEGVHAVALEPERAGLAIEYDPAILTPKRLVDLMCRCGVFPDARAHPEQETRAAVSTPS
jgi:hypothetical protein